MRWTPSIGSILIRELKGPNCFEFSGTGGKNTSVAVAETSMTPLIITSPVAAKYTWVFAALRLNFTVTPSGMLIVVKLKIPSEGKSTVKRGPIGLNGPSEPSEMTGAAKHIVAQQAANSSAGQVPYQTAITSRKRTIDI